MRKEWILAVFIIINCFHLEAQIWNQMGENINGETEIEASGRRVSMSADGTIIAIGAQFNDNNGTDSGTVRVYSWNGSSWIQMGNDIDGEDEFDQSGQSISLSDDGTIIAIGAPYNVVNSNFAGHTRVFTWNGTSWEQIGLDIEAENAEDRSGFSVSMNSTGSVVAIGAPYNDNLENDAGQVRVYEWNGNAWEQKGIDLDGLVESERFGSEVKLNEDGNTLAVGMPQNSNVEFLSGATRIFDWNGTAWTQRGNDINGESFGSQSGYSISLSNDGNTIAIGDAGTDTDTRIVRMFTWNGTLWEQKGATIPGGGDSPSHKPVSLSADGNIVAIGNGSSGAFGGYIRVYEWDNSSWVQIGLDIECNSTTEDCRRMVAINSTGDILAVGDPSNIANGNNEGQVRIFTTQTLSIDENNFNETKLYPNPTNGVLNLSFVDLENVSIKILDIMGRLVYQQEKLNTSNLNLDLTSQQNGFYFIEIFSENKSQVYKIIKQ